MTRYPCILLALLFAVPVYADPPANDGTTGPVPINTTVVDVAARNLKVAQADYDAFVEAKRKDFSESPVYVAAKKAVDDAAGELEALQAPLREQLKTSDPRYAQAIRDIVPAREKLAEAMNNRKPDDIAFRRSDVQYFQNVISKAEGPAFAKNEGVVAAQKKLDAANETLAAMQKRFNQTLNADADYQALAKALNNAKGRLAVAKSSGR